jgi:hypothetical protein
VGVSRLTNQKNGFYPLPNDVIQLGNRLFVIKIRGIPQAAQQIARTNLPGLVCREAGEMPHFHLGLIFEDLPEPIQPFLQGKKVLFLAVDANSDNDFIVKRQGSLNQVDMTNGDRVEGTWKNGDVRHVVELGGFSGIEYKNIKIGRTGY